MTKWQADGKIKRPRNFHYWAYVNTQMLSVSMLHYSFTYRFFEFWLFTHACISVLINKIWLQFFTNFEVHPQATRKHTLKITTVMVSYSFVTYPRSAHVIFFDLTGFWFQRKMLHISGLFLLPCCYNQPFSDKYPFSRTLNLFSFS